MLCFRPSPRGSFLSCLCSLILLRFCSVAICWQLLSVCILPVKNVCGPPYQLNEFHLSFFSIALFPALHYVCCFLVCIPVRLFSSLFSFALVPFIGRGMLVWYILPFSTGSLPCLYVLHMLLLLWVPRLWASPMPRAAVSSAASSNPELSLCEPTLFLNNPSGIWYINSTYGL